MRGTSAEASQDLFFRDTVLRYIQAPRFVRRDWLAGEVTAALAESSCRMLLLTGQPGAGKSGLVAQLVDEHPDWLVYFIRRDQRSPLSAATARAMLLRIGFQLAALRPELFANENVRVVVEQRVGEVMRDGSAVAAEVERMLSSPFHQTIVHIRQEVARSHGAVAGLRVREWVADPRLLGLDDLANMALLDPAAVLRRVDPAARITVMVDALDEVPYQPGEDTLLPWLAAAELPDNVRFILTSRPEPLFATLADRQGDRLLRLTIASGDDRVRDDLTGYARRLASGAEVAATLASAAVDAEGFVVRAVDKAAGNIGYLDALGRAVDQAVADLATAETGHPGGESVSGGQASLTDMLALDRLPDGLDDLYAFFLRQLRTGPGSRLVRVDDPVTGTSGRAEAWTELYHPMLEVLSVALEPLTAAQLSSLIDTQAAGADTVAALQRLSQFLEQVGPRYRLYHATLTEFLHAQNTRQNPDTADVAVDPQAAHRRLAARLRADLWLDTPAQPAEQERREYGRRNYVAHLFHGRLWDELFAVVDGGIHGRHRVGADPSTREFWAELEFAVTASCRETDEETAIALLPRLWRYTMLRHGLTQNADDQSADALAARVLLGGLEHAIGLTRLIGDLRRRAGMCGQVAELLTRSGGTASDVVRFADLARQAVTDITDPAEQVAGLFDLLSDRVAWSDAGAPADADELAALAGLARSVTPPLARVACLAVLARLLARDGAEPDLHRVLDEIEEVAQAAEEDQDEVLVLLAETYADCGFVEAAGQALGAIENVWHLLPVCVALAEYENAAELWPSLAERLDEMADLVAEIPDDDRYAALTWLGVAWRRLGAGDRALTFLRSAAEIHGGLHLPDAAVTRTLITELSTEGADDLRSMVVASTVEAAVESIAYPPPGQGFQVNIVAEDLAAMLASVGEPGAALHVADRLAPPDRPVALEHVVRAFAVAGLWDEATTVLARPEFDQRANPVSVDFDTGGLPAEASQADRGWYWIAVRLAEKGQEQRALEAAHRIESTRAECAALGVIARCCAHAGLADTAAAILVEHDRELRLNAARKGRMVAVPAAVHLLIAAKAWPAALAVFDIIRDGMGAFGWQPIEALAEALLAGGHREPARKAIAELLPERQVAMLVRWAEGADPTARAATLAEAERLTEQIDDPIERVYALDCLLRACVDREPDRAAALLRRAIAVLNPIERFGLWPTPWTTIVADLMLVGDPAAALDLAGRLPPDDAAVAYCEISETAQRTGAELDLEPILESAARLAAASQPPAGEFANARVAVEYARLGMLDRAVAVAADVPARRAVALHLAQTGHAQDALLIVGDDLGQQEHDTHVESAVVTGLLATGDHTAAERVARAVRNPGQRAGLLARTATALAPHHTAHAQQLARDALGLLPHMNQFDTEQVDQVATALTATDQLRTLLETIHQEWRGADGLDNLAIRLGLASPLVHTRPEIATGLANSFAWVDNFLELLGAPAPDENACPTAGRKP